MPRKYSMVLKVGLILVLLLVALSVNMLAAEQITIKVATWADESLDEVIEAFNKEYPKIKVEPVITAINDHHQILLTKIAAKAEVPDVAFLEVQYVGNIVAKGGFVDLSKPPYNATRYKDKIVPYTFAQVTTDDGRLVAMPTDIAPATIFYRKDRFDELGIKIEDIETMDEWIEAGLKFAKDLDGDGKYDRWLLADAGHIFWMYMRSSTYRYFDKDGNILIDSPRFVKALTMAKKIRELRLDGQIQEWTNDWYAALREGKVLMQPSGAWLGGHLKGWIAPETGGKWRAANFPDGMYAFWGGSFAGIPEGAKHKEAAWKFIEFVSTRPKIQLMCFRIADMFPSLLETYDDPIFDEPVEFYGGQRVRRMWAEVATKVPEVITTQYDTIAQSIVSTALSQVLDNDRDPEDALKEAKSILERRIRRRR